MSERYDYDPGGPYEPPRRRRRRAYRRESEYDDAWAAANEADQDFDDADIEDFAAGYHWEDRDRYGIETDDAPSVRDWRNSAPPNARVPSSAASARRSPSYHRDRARQNEYAEYYGPVQAPPSQKRKRVAEPIWNERPARGIPYWQILALVVMAVLALLATAFACASVLMLF